LPCMALLNSASRVWSSFSSAMGDMVGIKSDKRLCGGEVNETDIRINNWSERTLKCL
jgi:hypothetical protein